MVLRAIAVQPRFRRISCKRKCHAHEAKCAWAERPVVQNAATVPAVIIGSYGKAQPAPPFFAAAGYTVTSPGLRQERGRELAARVIASQLPCRRPCARRHGSFPRW